MAEFRVFTQVIKVYSLNIEAEDEKEALNKARKLSTTKIEEDGHLDAVEADYFEVEPS